MYKKKGGVDIFRSVVIGAIIGTLLCSIMIVITAFIVLKTGKLPTNAVYIVLQFIGALSAFIGSYISVRLYKSMGLLIGLATAFVMFVIVFVAGFATTTGGVSVMSLTRLVAMLCAGATGGILSVNKKKKVNKYR